ncbi:MAG: helix-turn-helix domain-containing protein [Deltaproteobacteria bacterium]|nr:helix-turn-helix domain-containing protein [Deltaproteobacteria bacterium]
MSQRQLQRYQVMGLVEAGEITLKEAADKIGLSYRQAKRIRKHLRERGVKGVIHGNTGKPSSHRIEEGLRAEVLQLSQEKYSFRREIQRESLSEFLQRAPEGFAARSSFAGSLFPEFFL